MEAMVAAKFLLYVCFTCCTGLEREEDIVDLLTVAWCLHVS